MKAVAKKNGKQPADRNAVQPPDERGEGSALSASMKQLILSYGEIDSGLDASRAAPLPAAS